ncbi:Hypothetical predicted protein [Mytilus galloprovincialis]|uniref:Reverse transcriptase/retrotransposon-derived protein RNase H-like domain-containing protein n=1 Tax=Mytilus galloprovincialis TaxID=29158 RepID=A0A8B6CEH0_MYTGA|nr:Hypothetical predicted protein [Mytilus galloprovincialis]
MKIDTGDARPIQLRMRRTPPACFVQEEEAHLKKMLDAGVYTTFNIRMGFSTSAYQEKRWRVRWCIDFRRLNSVTSRPSFDEHLNNLQNVYARFREYGLRLKPKKCALFRFRSVSNQGLQIGQQHLQPEVEQFLGFVNYHRSFIKDYAKISAPLYEVTGKNLFSWNHERQLAFQTLKDNLLSAPVLTLPNNKDYFILDTDASKNAIGAELIQVQDGEERTIAYGSFVLTAEQKRYCTTRKELLADTILASLPCKGCNYCQRAHQSWAQFLCDVDEAVPLARKRKQKPRLLKRVATAMMMLFETPEKVSTLEQPAVPVESAVMTTAVTLAA